MAEKQYDTPEERPTGKVASLGITRSGYKLTAKWKVPTGLTSKSGDNGKKRTTELHIDFVIDRFKPGKKKDPKDLIKCRDTSDEKATSRSIKLNGFSISKGKKKTHYDRKSFYPVTNAYVEDVTVKVWCANEVDKKVLEAKEPATATYSFGKPGKPTISALTQTEDEGHIQFTITAYDPKKTHNERYDTRYQIETFDTRTMKKPKLVGGTFTGSEKKWTTEIDVADRQHLTYNQYVRYRVRAMSRGFAGMSDGLKVGKEDESKAWTSWKQLVVSYPNEPLISDIILPDDSATGKVTVVINTKSNKNKHPVTGVRLQTLVQSDATTPAQAVADDRWNDVESQDDGECTALAITVADLVPRRGKHTWVRIKTWNQFEGIFYRFSQPVEVTKLFKEEGSVESRLKILDLVSGDDGTSLVADVAWTSGEEPETGTELSWSTDENAWRSTAGPTTHEFSWSDGAITKGGVRYTGSAKIHIQGLTQGERYFVKGRRFYEGERDKVYSGYSDASDAMPVSSPKSVVLSAAGFIPRGSDLPLTWTYDSDATQREWQVITGPVVRRQEGDGTQSGETRESLWIDPAKAVIVARASDALGATIIRAEWFSSDVHEQYVIADGSVPLAVRMGTGGSLVDSEAVTVRVVDPPVLTATVPETVTAQPFHIGLSCNVQARIAIVVRATEASNGGNGPAGPMTQAGGDVVWQTALTPPWTEGEDAFTATIDSPVDPSVLELHQNGTYEVTVCPTDTETGLVGAQVTDSFVVDWEHKAPVPPINDITVAPSDTTDEKGNRTRMCVITLVPPAEYDETDVYDVYRLTPDGAYLIAQGVGLEGVVTDEYAPFGGTEIGYRIATRTSDGDMNWADIGYELPGKDLRVDFGSEYVELPYNLVPSDSYSKDFEARRKLSGDIDGYWNDGVMRNGSFSTDLIRVSEQAKAAAVRRLGKHVGPVFVRTPDGCAFQANVEVSDMSGARRNAALAVTLDVTEVDLTQAFWATVEIPTIEEEEETPGGDG